jgi:hypothetical protein
MLVSSDPPAEAIKALYQEYMAELDKLRAAVDDAPGFWELASPDVRVVLQTHFQNPLPIENWLNRVR